MLFWVYGRDGKTGEPKIFLTEAVSEVAARDEATGHGLSVDTVSQYVAEERPAPSTTRRGERAKVRYYQIRLRTLLVVVLVLGCLLMPIVHRWHCNTRQQAVIDEILRLEGTVSYRYEYGEWWQHPLGEELFDSIDTVAVRGEEVSDLSPFSGMTHLREFKVEDNSVSDLSPLAGLTRLEKLHLGRRDYYFHLTVLGDPLPVGTGFSDLSPLAGLTKLRVLALEDQTSVVSIAPLAALTQLEELHLGGTSVSDLSPLAGLTKLRFLHLDRTAVSDLSPLSNLRQLEVLDLNDTKVSDLSPLAGCKRLKLIRLRDTSVSDLHPLVETIHNGYESREFVEEFGRSEGYPTIVLEGSENVRIPEELFHHILTPRDLLAPLSF